MKVFLVLFFFLPSGKAVSSDLRLDVVFQGRVRVGSARNWRQKAIPRNSVESAWLLEARAYVCRSFFINGLLKTMQGFPSSLLHTSPKSHLLMDVTSGGTTRRGRPAGPFLKSLGLVFCVCVFNFY